MGTLDTVKHVDKSFDPAMAIERLSQAADVAEFIIAHFDDPHVLQDAKAAWDATTRLMDQVDYRRLLKDWPDRA